MEIEGHDKIAPRNEPKRHFRFNCTALVAIISNNLEQITSHETNEYQWIYRKFKMVKIYSFFHV